MIRKQSRIDESERGEKPDGQCSTRGDVKVCHRGHSILFREFNLSLANSIVPGSIAHIGHVLTYRLRRIIESPGQPAI
jgi:hypothetical protein